jgi:hypothetical protein
MMVILFGFGERRFVDGQWSDAVVWQSQQALQ